jgi:uncharacterized protein
MKTPTMEKRMAMRERPRRTAVMYQTWKDLLFLHWTFDPDVIQRTLPPGLEVDCFQGRAYVGVTPFFMRDVRPKWSPPIPGISNFLELNVRTYVFDREGRPGVWFYSLDCNNWLAVPAARLWYFLPYYAASMRATVEERNGKREFAYESNRDRVETQFQYKEMAPLGPSQPGSLEFFLVERYLLFSWNTKRSRLYSGRVHHAPYSLSAAEVTVCDQRMLEVNGLALQPRAPSHQVMSPGVVVEVFGLEEIC